MSKDARIAAVEGLKGAIISAAELAHSKCAVTSGCDFDAGSGARITVGGVTGALWYGYPAESTRNGFLGIEECVNLSGFTYSATANIAAYFDKDSAPTPSACRVTYTFSSSGGPTVTTTTSGC